MKTKTADWLVVAILTSAASAKLVEGDNMVLYNKLLKRVGLTWLENGPKSMTVG